ncbi:MAG: hypothetical protein IJN29_02590 [Akkermansia sp.]|nr:hypothetical protein [Akkermansia sp.]
MKPLYLLLSLLCMTATARGLKPTCPAEVSFGDYYPTFEARANRQYQGKLSEVQIRGTYLLHHPKDDAAFIAFCDRELPYADVMLPENKENIPDGGLQVLSTAVHYKYQLEQMRVSRALTRRQRPEFLLAIRDALSTEGDYEQYMERLLRIVSEDNNLTEDELGILANLLKNWYGMGDCHLVQARQLQFILRNFAGGKPVILDAETESMLTARYPHLIPLLHAERALNGSAPRTVNRWQNWHRHALHNLLWRHTEGAILLARKLDLPGYELLRQDASALLSYLRHRGITYYRDLGQDVPQSCLSALGVHSFESPRVAAETVRKQLAELEPELRPLAPRCMLALGNGQADWHPVQISTQGVHPSWPDASAVTLPMWKPALLGLADEKASTVQAAFSTDLEALEKLLSALREEHGAAGIVLSRMLRECDRVRPVYRDLVIPIYARIALHFDADGLTVDYNPEQQSFEIEEMWNYTGAPIVDEALCKAPQLLHRLTLQLALLEKHGHKAELEQACGQMSRVLNRCDLWPLVICQRELRGFSPQALLTLFAYYEGERAPLATYGEAMGMSNEMRLAAHAPEDELGEVLALAAHIGGAIPGTEEQRREAAEKLLTMAKSSAAMVPDTVEHLLRHGRGDLLQQWQELPASALQGSYAGNGLLLIRHHLKNGRRDAAQKVLELMAQDAATDTTPSYRLACALLSNDSEQQERLQKDALILAMFYRHVDHRVYEAWRDALAREGEQVENLMKAELLLSGGRNAGITPLLAQHYEAAGQWNTAAFCYEYLIAEGISAATPYGQVPDHAAICRYRGKADECRRKAAQPTP